MSTSRNRHRSPAFRPGRESLEERWLLTKVISGVDADGDTWVLRLFGPGDVSVVKQAGSNGLPIPLDQPGLIRSITIGGANPGQTRLVGAVTRSATGDGRVYFQTLSETASNPPGLGVGVGTLAVDLPDFWLANTNPTNTSTTAGTISFPDGVQTLRFGGVDSTAFGLNTNGRADKFSINLGLPTRTGTSIIIDRSISAFQPGTGPNAAGFQDTVDFTVEGRINLFQANAIEGDPTLNLGPTGRFEGNTFNQVGTTVTSTLGGATRLGGITGFIGRVRVGGNATNFNVRVVSATGDSGAITNLSIGGETNKVTIDAATGLRAAQFGLGLDTVAINAERIQSLGANRGAIGSTIVTQRDAGLLNFGGDVVNTQVLAGYAEDSSGNRVAQEFGRMTVLVAGDVVDSVFAASVDPNEDGVFGSADDLNGISGGIDAKVEGTIDNSLNPDVDPNSADQAFFARRLHVAQGPITPPASQAPPYKVTHGLPRTPGVRGIGGGPRGPVYRFVRNLTPRPSGA